MTFWDWAASPQGVEVVHAVVILCTALAAWFSYRAKQHVKVVDDKLQGHLDDVARHRAADPPAS